MRGNLLFAVAGITLLFAGACSDSSFSSGKNAAVPVITVQPQGAAYGVGASAAALTVTASVSDGGTLSYQWYGNTENSNKNGTIISGATGARYTPSTNAPGIFYYYVVVTNTLNEKTSGITSVAAKIEVNVNAAVPVITVQPQRAVYSVGASAEDLTVAASVSDGGTLSYQWYSNTKNNNKTGTPIDGADGVNYPPPITEEGVMYYYVMVTNTISDNGDGGNKTATRESAVAGIEVNEKVNAAVPVITGQPQRAVYSIGVSAADLKVAASVNDDGILSYQWYSHTINSTTGGTLIPSATGARYTPPTAAEGVMYYYVMVTNTIEDNGDGGNKTAAAVSAVVEITVNDKVNAAVPDIIVQPRSVVWTTGNEMLKLEVAASVSDGGTLSYQWYSHTINRTTGGTLIPGATGAQYKPPINVAGTMYYYVIVTNAISDNSDGGNKIAPMVSDTAEIKLV